MHHEIEKNPYSKAFLSLQGDCILDKIQDNLSNDGYSASEKLINTLLNDNQVDSWDSINYSLFLNVIFRIIN